FTPGTNLVPINGVRNSASRAIFAIGSVTIGGTIIANDTITGTIGMTGNTKDYTYKLGKDDTGDTILTDLAEAINTGSGAPFVLAVTQSSLSLVKLVARRGGTDGNNISLSTKVSDKATIQASASGTTLQNGQDATVIGPGTIVSFFCNSDLRQPCA